MGTKLNGQGGEGGQVAIYDEGILVHPGATEIDFKGVDVLARTETSPDRVHVYIPPPQWVSHWNTTDGLGNAIVPSTSTSSRHVSNPGAFNIGAWSAGDTVSCIRTPAGITISYSPNGDFSMVDLTTTLETTVYGADDVTPIAVFTFAADGASVTLDSNKSTNNIANNIHYTTINTGADATKQKCDITITIDIDTIIPNGGRFSVEIIHYNGVDGNFTKTQGPLFFDPESQTAVINGPVTIAETVGQVITKTISGVYYYDLNSQFTINANDYDYPNTESYPTNQIGLEGADYGLPSFTDVGSNITGWINVWNDLDDTYTKTDWAINSVNFFRVDNNAAISAWPIDWVAEASLASAGSRIAVCTYTDNSSGVFEDFRREDERIQSDFSGWNNFEDLKVEDDGQGLQVTGISAVPSTDGSKLIWPSFDYSLYNPQQTLPAYQPDYSAGIDGNGDRWYMRSFYHTGTSHSNGLFEFGDHNITDAKLTAGNITIEISLDGIAWYDAWVDYIGGALVNGSGCKINGLTNTPSINNSLEFTLGFGGFTAVGTGTGWGIYWRITYSDDATGRAVYLGSTQITNW